MAFEPSGDDTALIIHREFEGERITALFNFGDQPFPYSEALVSEGDLMLSSRPLKEGLIRGGKIPERAGVWIRAIK